MQLNGHGQRGRDIPFLAEFRCDFRMIKPEYFSFRPKEGLLSILHGRFKIIAVVIHVLVKNQFAGVMNQAGRKGIIF